MCKIGRLIANNGWDTNYNLVKYNLGVWEPILKKVWFEMEFMPCPYFLMYDSEAMLPPLNENPTHDLT